MERRRFLSQSCLACGSILGLSAFTSVLQSCTSLERVVASNTKKSYSLDPSSFKESNMLILQRNDAEFDALIVRQPDGNYLALEMKCSHQAQPLTATQDGLYCSSHGSSFNLEGKVLIAPATQDLRTFPTHLENNKIIITFS